MEVIVLHFAHGSQQNITHKRMTHKSELLHFKNTRVSNREFDMRALFGFIINVNKDSNSKTKARTKDSGFVLKDNQGPKTKAKDNIPGYNTAGSVVLCVSDSVSCQSPTS